MCLCLLCNGQPNDRIPYREKTIQFSTFPGISTGGFESGKYTYHFSFNLFSGITAGSKYLAIASISNIGMRSSSGIQLAGLANVIGSQSYIHLTNYERKELENEGKTPNQTGIQIAGLLNMVRGESTGIQITTGMNSVHRNASGFHLAGIGNSVGGNMIGTQTSLIYNSAKGLVIGAQLGIANVTGTRLSGVQLGALNRAKFVEGKANSTTVRSFGLQVGLFNNAQTNNGFQIGLVNRTKRMRGVQFGVINLFNKAPYDGANRYNGVPIGLLNIGSKDSKLRVSTSGLLPLVVEYTTGNCHNCTFTKAQMPFSDIFYKTNQNALIFSRKLSDDADIQWAAGYGFQRVYYYKNSMAAGDPKNKKYFFSPALRFIHLNRGPRPNRTLSLLTQLQFDIGYRLGSTVGVYTGVSLNGYWYQSGDSLNIRSEVVSVSANTSKQVWFDYVFGIQI